jgi:hypothetical protein
MAPSNDCLKMIWDTALGSSPPRMGVGVVVRDEQGRVRAALAMGFPNISDPTVAEAMALWKATTFCLELGFT